MNEKVPQNTLTLKEKELDHKRGKMARSNQVYP